MSILNEARATDLGLSSVKEKDEMGVLRSIDFLAERGTEYINKRLEPDAKRAVICIKNIGKAAALQKMEAGVFISLISLGKMAKAAAGQTMPDTGLSILYSLGAIGKAAAEQEMEAAVRVAAAYLGEIVNSASLQKKKDEAFVAVLALGTMGKGICRNSPKKAPDNGGFFPFLPGIILSPPAHGGAAIITEDLSDDFGMMTLPGEESPQEGESLFPEKRSSGIEDEALGNAIIRAAHSLETIRLEADEKYLISHVLTAKTALEVFDGFEIINEAEIVEK